MKKDVVIKVEGLSKQYSIGKRDSYLTLRDKLMELPNKIFKREKTPTFWALKDVSFEVKRGEVLGVIGRNGAGKSTLLKILARITEPTKGKITMRGRVASMLEVGTGFNPELTGRENIYLNGSILGMSRSEIQTKFKEITDFAGIGKFLDTPVKHYSSGMYIRLAFAVAAHLDSDILLVDEVLAVGDAEFQKKCLGKMGSLAKSGKTVIFVSHDLISVSNICSKVLYIKSGIIYEIGNTKRVIEKYIKKQSVETINSNGIKVRVFNEKGKKIDKIQAFKPVTFIIEIQTTKKLDNCEIAYGIQTSRGQRIITFDTGYQLKKKYSIQGKQKYEILWKNNYLKPGSYSTTISIYSRGVSVLSEPFFEYFTVEWADYYKTGLMPRTDQGYILSDVQWMEQHE